MQHFGKAALRVTKNYTKGYSDTQAKVRDATSNDPWGPSGTQMNEIAQLTYNQNDFIEIMEMLDKRLNDKGKNWRHVFKSLTVLDYCLHQGSENVVIYFRDNIYVVKTLKEFQYVDEDGKDQGANVRQKAKDITNLLQDESRLREERRTRASMRDRMIRGVGGDEEPIDENISRRKLDPNGLVGKRPNRDEEELRRAIEESKKSLAQDRLTAEERDLQQALKLSQEEEEKRKQDMDSSNASALFDDTNQLPPPSATHSNNPFPLIDPTPYAVGLQPQYTVQPQFTQMQPQFTAFNPYQQQAQAEQEAQQAEFLRQQQMFMLQQQQAQQQQQQEDWLRQQQLLQMQQQQQQQQHQQQNLFAQQPIQLQPTGFGNNNPFAPTSPSSLSPSPNPAFQQQRPSPSFNLGGTYENHSSSALASLSASPQPQQQPQQQAASPAPGRPIQVKTKDQNEALAALFADREGGQDTFGNVGQLRYGYTDAGRNVLAQQKTGSSHNPFAIQQQQQQQQQNERPFFDI
ncbi:epsin domain-containing protein [Pholiota molesta]|nr:epsin domain-containing protein [Pholiota molesta]